MYNLHMKTISTTQARKNISSIINIVKETGETVALGRHNKIDALIIKFPYEYNKSVSEITNMNAYSGSFDFLNDEPDIYSVDDLKKRYV